jgi:hypothetical protein
MCIVVGAMRTVQWRLGTGREISDRSPTSKDAGKNEMKRIHCVEWKGEDDGEVGMFEDGGNDRE